MRMNLHQAGLRLRGEFNGLDDERGRRLEAECERFGDEDHAKGIDGLVTR